MCTKSRARPGLPLMVFRDIREHLGDIFGGFSGNGFIYREAGIILSKKISNDQELIQSDPISCPQNQKGNN